MANQRITRQSVRKQADVVTGDSRMSNAELVEQFGDQLATGAAVIFAVEETSNPDFVHVFVAQNATTEDYLDQSGNTGGVMSRFEAENAFDDATRREFILRSHFNVRSEKADQYEVGATIEGVKIQIWDSTVPLFEGHSPRISSQTGEIYLNGGKPIYRHTSVVYEDEFDGHHNLAVQDRIDPSQLPEDTLTA